jgi:hypothetical protein
MFSSNASGHEQACRAYLRTRPIEGETRVRGRRIEGESRRLLCVPTLVAKVMSANATNRENLEVEGKLPTGLPVAMHHEAHRLASDVRDGVASGQIGGESGAVFRADNTCLCTPVAVGRHPDFEGTVLS